MFAEGSTIRKKFFVACLLGWLIFFPGQGQQQKRVTSGFLIDQRCAAFYVESQPEKLPDHSKGCVSACGLNSGFGLIVRNRFILFDKKGNELASAWLKSTDKNKDLQVEVTFLVDGDTWEVEKIKD